MHIDEARLRHILKSELSYYGTRNATIHKDGRLNLFPSDFLATQITPGMRVLDLGCGNGQMLLDNCARFKAGVGVDNDPSHIHLARDAQQKMAADNVEFLVLTFPDETEQLGLESFDIVFSNLGPLGNSPVTIQAGLDLLKPDGLMLCAEIGELHQPEVAEIFGNPPHGNQGIRVGERLRTWMVECGLEIRLTADMIAKWIYPDIYEWFYYQCSLWTWLGVPLPAADDLRLDLFAKRNTNARGEIETTHHVAWVAGVKNP